MKASIAEANFHQAQKDAGALSCEIDRLRSEIAGLERNPAISAAAVAEKRRLLADLKVRYGEASDRMDSTHPVMMRAIKRCERVEAWTNVIILGLICAFVLPIIGAIAIPGLATKLVVGAVFGLAMRFLFRLAEPVQMLMGAGFASGLVFCAFLAVLIVVPILLLGAISVTGLVAVLSLPALSIGMLGAIAVNWCIPTVVGKLV